MAIASGERTVERDFVNGWISKITMEGVDAEGRELHAVGTPVSRIIINRHSFIDINSLVHWSINGEDSWGEDQDMWPMARFSALQRSNRLR